MEIKYNTRLIKRTYENGDYSYYTQRIGSWMSWEDYSGPFATLEEAQESLYKLRGTTVLITEVIE